MRRALAAAAAVATCATLAATALGATARSIKIGDNYFVRPSGVPTVTVTRNTRLTWRWTGDSLHDVRVSSGPIKFHSKTQTSGTYSRVMSRRGTYKLFCQIHGPKDQSMVLRVK
jgi:plastocyanin